MSEQATTKQKGDAMLPNVAHLLEVRLWVARLGESDVCSWWRTDGALGPDGAFVGPRVLPLTHPTARARMVFAVAAYTCCQRHPDPQARTLFSFDAETEDRLDALLVERLGDQEFWGQTMIRLEALSTSAVPAQVLLEGGLINREDLRYVESLELGPGGRSLPVGPGCTPEETVRRLTAGFARSERGNLVVPYLES